MSAIVGDRCMRSRRLCDIRSSDEVEEETFLAWQAWQAVLTPDELVALESVVGGAPELPRKARRTNWTIEDEEGGPVGTCDHLASPDLDPLQTLIEKEIEAGIDDGEGPAFRFRLTPETKRDLAVLNFVLAEIIGANDPRLVASMVALAIGIGARQSIEPKALAKRHNVGFSWLQRKVREWELRLNICRVSMQMLRLVISPILASRNPRLEAESIAMAARFGLSGGASMTAIGEHHGVCKAAVSTRVREWVKKLGLPLPRECKAQTANYVLHNVRRQKSQPLEE